MKIPRLLLGAILLSSVTAFAGPNEDLAGAVTRWEVDRAALQKALEAGADPNIIICDTDNGGILAPDARCKSHRLSIIWAVASVYPVTPEIPDLIRLLAKYGADANINGGGEALSFFLSGAQENEKKNELVYARGGAALALVEAGYKISDYELEYMVIYPIQFKNVKLQKAVDDFLASIGRLSDAEKIRRKHFAAEMAEEDAKRAKVKLERPRLDEQVKEIGAKICSSGIGRASRPTGMYINGKAQYESASGFYRITGFTEGVSRSKIKISISGISFIVDGSYETVPLDSFDYAGSNIKAGGIIWDPMVNWKPCD